ncbi:MAG TPA: glycosyltransferase family 2 protein [Casimicrobiaceae bacterium]|nr:glycosyltransferase family 2 protein [Casimicrobiaceae bacterium]
MNVVAVVIPAYNEAATIRDVVERTLNVMPSVVVVDDGSVDGTRDALAGLPVTVIVNERNQGKAHSLWRGARVAIEGGATSIVTLDGDGQHHPEDLPKILRAAALKPNAIIVGSRLHARDIIPRARYRANRFANFWIAWAAGQPLADSQSGFRHYPAHVFGTLDVRHDRWSSFVFESEVIVAAARAGIEIVCVPIAVTYANPARASHFRPVADIAKITMMIAGRLLATGLNLPGLVRSLRRAAPAGTYAAPARIQRKQ